MKRILIGFSLWALSLQAMAHNSVVVYWPAHTAQMMTDEKTGETNIYVTSPVALAGSLFNHNFFRCYSAVKSESCSVQAIKEILDKKVLAHSELQITKEKGCFDYSCQIDRHRRYYDDFGSGDQVLTVEKMILTFGNGLILTSEMSKIE